jgi:hypothetical protein
MFKKILFPFLFIFIFFAIIYPTKQKNIELFNYCHSLEILLSSNSIQNRKNLSSQVRSNSKVVINFGISKTRGALINKIVNQYKSSRNSYILSFLPNNLICFAGYWIEFIKPGTFELFFFEKSKIKIKEFKDFKDDLDEFLNNINSEYKSIKKEFNSFL